MKDISELTTKEIEKEAISIFNNNSWILRPDLDKLSEKEIQLYQRYEDLNIALNSHYFPKYSQ